MKGKNLIKKKGKNSTFKDIIYGLKILNKYSKGLVLTRIIAMFGFWFFTGFIEEILFLKYLLINTHQAFQQGENQVIS